MKRLLLVVIALILYGSFYPWQFYARHLTVSPFWILLHSWPAEFDRYVFRDMVVNTAIYVPFGTLCFFCFRASQRVLPRAVLVLGAATLLSLSVELIQLFDRSRVTSLFDIVCNDAGACIGILIAASFPGVISGAVGGVEGALRVSGPVALLYLWAGAELFPVFPVISRTAVRQKVAVLFTAQSWQTRDLLESLGAWLAVFVILEHLVGPRRAAQIGAFSLVLIPLKLLILHRSMSAAELAGAILGGVLWSLFRLFGRPSLANAIVALAALILAQLLPWQISAVPQLFDWIPFLPSLSSSWDTALLILLKKAFLYGSAIWLWRQTNIGWRWSSLWVAISLALTEGIQIYLPGRTPEITDAVLALIMGFALWRLERRDAAHSGAA